jgi:hypothetical protein
LSTENASKLSSINNKQIFSLAKFNFLLLCNYYYCYYNYPTFISSLIIM